MRTLELDGLTVAQPVVAEEVAAVAEAPVANVAREGQGATVDALMAVGNKE